MGKNQTAGNRVFEANVNHGNRAVEGAVQFFNPNSARMVGNEFEQPFGGGGTRRGADDNEIWQNDAINSSMVCGLLRNNSASALQANGN